MKKTNINPSRFIYLLIVVFAFNVSSSIINILYADNARGVLVAAESSQVQKVSVLEIRRIYLGLPSSAESLIKSPVINSSDSVVYKSFLKNIMHMTEKGYQRKIVKRIFRQGGRKVKDIQNISELVKHLEKNMNDISFMDEQTAKNTKGIRVVQVLW